VRRYRKKPVVVEAAPWIGGALAATPIIDWVLAGGGTARYHEATPAIKGQDGETVVFPACPERILIDTLEGAMRADVGDWVIRGVKGEFYPCKPAIFEATYEVAE
jgi:hypothetical protein